MFRRVNPPSMTYLASLSVYNTEQLAVSPHLNFAQSRPEPKRTTPIKIDNHVIQLTYDPTTGSLLKVTDLASNNVTEINLSFEYYKSQGSGAYIFRPNGPSMGVFHNAPIIRIFQGPLVSRIEVDFEPYITHKITLYSQPALSASAVHIENIINILTLKDKELIMRLSTGVQNTDESFFTDQNGFQFIRRLPNNEVNVEGNYYPMSSAAFLEDRDTRVTLMAAQPHGVAVLDKGQLEVMLDRQLLQDDGRGLGEPVEDIKTTTLNFVLFVERRAHRLATLPQSHTATMSLAALIVNDALQQPPVLFFSSVSSDVFYRTVSPVRQPLPCDVSAVSLRSLNTGSLQYNGTSVILHRRGYDCGFPTPTALLCQPSDPNLTFGGLLEEFSFSNVKETSLTHTTVTRALSPTEKLNLNPMEIYAYHLQL